MFKGHPKGLIAAAMTNMGERFGVYTMMAILVLFLQAKFGLDGKNAGIIYSVFYALIYVLSLVGGIIADRTGKFKGTIMSGLIVMSFGYVLMSIPSEITAENKSFFLILTLVALFVISFGNGLFKGNLQALVGQMYDNPEYEPMRDRGFSLFYMFINVGAIFAPFTAIGVRNWWLEKHDYVYNADLPALCHAYADGVITPDATSTLQTMANEVSKAPVTDLGAFVNSYLEVFVTGFHYAFAVAILAMAISFAFWVLNKKHFPDPQSAKQKAADNKAAGVVEMDAKEVKQRMYALFAVFGVVIFFWFSFHQNGLTLTFFAKDYTDLSAMAITIFGVKIEGAELFQSMNPFFVVFLTPIIVGMFGWLRNKKDENSGMSTPMKIAIGMFIAGGAYLLLSIASKGLPPYSEINPDQGGVALDAAQKVTPWLLIAVYFILTVAELFISPLGLSFVSKVAPPQYQGVMQGAWLGATAVGNQLLFIGAILYETVPLSVTWATFIVVTVISGIVMLSMVKWLEKITADKKE